MASPVDPQESPSESQYSMDTNTTLPSLSNTPTVPSTDLIIAESFSLDTIPRFFHLLTHAKTLISQYGPHTTYANTTIFARSPVPRVNVTSDPLSSRVLAASLAAAQDTFAASQPAGPANDDLQLFKLLWEATVAVLDKIIEAGELDQETFGWGVFGLSSGYMTETTSADVFGLHDPAFDILKKRLYAALTALPSIDSPEPGRQQIAVSGPERINQLQKARREIHICSNLLVQKFRSEEWRKIRWWHGIVVAERWIGNVNMALETIRHEEREEGAGREVETEAVSSLETPQETIQSSEEEMSNITLQ